MDTPNVTKASDPREWDINHVLKDGAPSEHKLRPGHVKHGRYLDHYRCPYCGAGAEGCFHRAGAR